jgi:diguanylate cyclase (GGDEF)-like protein/PAS domain S-box-containing protein
VNDSDPNMLGLDETRRLLVEMQARQAELEAQNEERRRTRLALLDSLKRYAELYDFVPVGYVTLSERGLIGDLNRAASRMLGIAPGTLSQQPFRGLVLPADRELYDEYLKDLLATGALLECELRLIRPDRDLYWVRLDAILDGDDANATRLYRVVISDITQQKQLENALRESEEHFRQLIAAAPLPLSSVTADGIVQEVNNRFTAVYGYSREDVPTADAWFQRAYPDETYRSWVIETWSAAVRKASMQGTDVEPIEYRVTCKNGDVRTMLISGVVIGPNLLVAAIDLTDRKRAEAERQQANEALRKSEELLTLFMRHSPVYAYIKEVTPTVSRVLQASENFQKMIGVSGSELAGKTMPELFPAEFAAKMTADDWAVIADGKVLTLDEVYEGRHYTSIKFPIVQGDRTLLAGYTIDITERKSLEERLQQQATTDEVTGVTNRRRFLEVAHDEIRRARRHARPLALALVDIDHFKDLNDAHGHAAGDLVLKVLADVCQRNIREIDVFARIGGDEFAMLLPETGRDKAYEVVQRFCLALASEPVELGGRSVAITVSAGIAGLAKEADCLDALLKRADQALYRAKAAGRNRVMVEPAAE